MTTSEGFLNQRQRYQSIKLPQDFSDEEMARDWTLSDADKKEISKYRKNSRIFIAIQLSALRLYGRFLAEANGLSPRIVNYLNNQLGLPPSLTVATPEREATFSEYRKNILNYLGFSKYNDEAQARLQKWLEQQALQANLPDELFLRAERYLLAERVVLPGASVLERLVISVCAETHEQLFEVLCDRLTPELRTAIDNLLVVQSGDQRSLFYLLKEYPPSASISSIQTYLERYRTLCYLLGYYFMPRIRDLKDQQLYKVDRNVNHGIFNPLLNKTADIDIVEEQWEAMIHVAQSLKERTTPAHVIVQRLTNSFPADRLSMAFTNLGRIIKTEYILRYITDKPLRQTVQLQLNKGEYRHKLPRWVFFANQGEFTTGDYEEIMNKTSCLSLVSNAILYWNTSRISDIVEGLRNQGEIVDDETLAHISLLTYKHVLPNGTYFIEEE